MGKKNNKWEAFSWHISQRPGRPGQWQARKQFGRKDNGKPNIKAFYGRSEAEVKNKAREYEAKLLTNQLINDPQKTVYEYVKEWLNVEKKYYVKAKTYDGLEDSLEKRLKPYDIANIQMKHLSHLHCQNYINQLVESPENYTIATIRKSYSLLNQAFKDAVENKDLTKNPMKSVKLPVEEALGKKTKEITFFTEEQMTKIYNEICRKYNNGKYYYYYGNVIEFLVRTGSRINEALALLWRDFDENSMTVSINKTLSIIKNRNKTSESDSEYVIIETYPKTDKSKRKIKLSKKALSVLESIKKQAKMYGLSTGPDDYIFQSRTGNIVSARNVQRTLDAILKNTGIYDNVKCGGEDKKNQNQVHYGLHSLRHTFATILIIHGVPINVVSAMLGHKKVSTTYNIYVHVIEAQKMQALDTLDDII